MSLKKLESHSDFVACVCASNAPHLGRTVSELCREKVLSPDPLGTQEIVHSEKYRLLGWKEMYHSSRFSYLGGARCLKSEVRTLSSAEENIG